MGKHPYYEADCRRLNQEASLITPEARYSRAEKLLNRFIPKKKAAAPLQADSPAFRNLAETISGIKARVNWEQELGGATFAAFDTETTGLDPLGGDEIISVGAVIIEGGRVLDEPVFHRLVNPRRPLTPRSIKITGITETMLQNKPTICTVLTDFLEFTGPRPLIAHNAPFDLSFFNLKIGEAVGQRLVNPVIDTAMLAAALYPALDSYSLEGLAPVFKLDLTGRHSALGDARITARFFLALLPCLLSKGIDTLPRLSRLLCDAKPPAGLPLVY